MLRMLCLLGLSFAAVGCRICDSPYDYCGPVQPCGEYGSCGAGGCGGGCSSCGGGGGHMHGQAYEGETIFESTPSRMTPSAKPMKQAPEMAPVEEMPMKQTRRNVPHPAAYREEVRQTRGYEDAYAGRGSMPVEYNEPVSARPRTTPKMARAKGPIVW